MKAVAVFSLFALTFAADHVPVTIENQDPSFDVNCGKTAISGRDIYNAAAWGMSLNQSSETRQGKSPNPYPHYYGNSDGFKWASSQCGGSNNNRVLMPVIKGAFFGEDGNNDEGKYRVVYSYNTSDSDTEGHPLGYYCGTIYHASSDNSFSGCDVTKS